MNRRTSYKSYNKIVLATAVSVLITACASSRDGTAPTTSSAAQGSGPVTLVRAATGIAAIRAGGTSPIWHDETAVAAPDGSAVVGVLGEGKASQLAGIDPRTGRTTLWAPLGGALRVAVVAPDARFVALTNRSARYGPDPGRQITEIRIVDNNEKGRSIRTNLSVSGDVEPEAFSVDGKLLFVLAHRDHTYRVQQIDLATGERVDVSDRDKTIQAETMHGDAMHAVLDRNRKLLATLYRDPNNAGHPTFVHVLDLEHAWASCVDLPAQFGKGPIGSETIELTPKNTAVVSEKGVSQVAEIRIEDVLVGGSTPVSVFMHDRVVSRDDEAFAVWPEFRRIIAPLD